jgi:hypothetical protein
MKFLIVWLARSTNTCGSDITDPNIDKGVIR